MVKKQTANPRTYARNRAFSRRGNEKIYESDSSFFLKLVGVLILGSLWLKLAEPVFIGNLPITGVPLGLIVGLFLVRKFENYQANRKIWYAILLVTCVLSYFVPAGIVI